MASGVIDNLAAAVGRMSKRERYMVGGVSIVFVFFVGFLLTMWIGSTLTSMENRIEDKTKKLQKLIDYQSSYEEAKRERKEAERILREGRRIQLMSTVPNIASEIGFDVDNMKPRDSMSKNDKVDQENVEVKIRLITIDRLVDFLKRLESKSRTIAIRSLHVSNNFRQPDHLDVSFMVSNVKPKAGQSEDSMKTSSTEKSKKKTR